MKPKSCGICQKPLDPNRRIQAREFSCDSECKCICHAGGRLAWCRCRLKRENCLPCLPELHQFELKQLVESDVLYMPPTRSMTVVVEVGHSLYRLKFWEAPR